MCSWGRGGVAVALGGAGIREGGPPLWGAAGCGVGGWAGEPIVGAESDLWGVFGAVPCGRGDVWVGRGFGRVTVWS